MSVPDTRHVEIGSGALARVPELFTHHFGDRAAIVVADPNTFAAAGEAVQRSLDTPHRFLFAEREPHAEWAHVEDLEAALSAADGVPVAVGSGTINDLTKLVAHRLGRPYMVVGTAASMDGYTAFGASITYEGSKQTFSCPAPAVVVADLDVLSAAPPELGAAGYADLLAKVTSGADWILADALGEEPIDTGAWDLVQGPLRDALADPAGVRAGDPEAVRRLAEGLMASGMAMQHSRTSRPASGAEHQFSHLWDMEGHTHHGRMPYHGFKVGIATIAVARLYERLLDLPLEQLDVDACCDAWPDWPETERTIDALFCMPAIQRKAGEESEAKWIHRDALRSHLERLKAVWPELREQLRAQLMPADEIRRRLAEVGAPVEPEQIGIGRERLERSHLLAYYLRRRYTVLDLAFRIGQIS